MSSDRKYSTTSIKRGNDNAFQAFVEAYYTPLFNFVNSYLKDQDTSKDIVQDSFIKLWLKRKELLENISLSQYLFTIARNLCIDHFRKQKIEDQYLFSLNRTDYFTLNDQSLKQLIQKEFLEEVEKEIQKLPPQCEKIFRMHRMDGLKYREIAKELGISERTVENQISKAMRILRKFLKDHR